MPNSRKIRMMIVLAIFVVFNIGLILFDHGQKNQITTVPLVSYGELVDMAHGKKLKTVSLSGNRAIATTKTDTYVAAMIPDDARPTETFINLGVDVSAMPKPPPGFLSTVLSWVPTLLMMGFIFWVMRSTSGRGKGGIFSIGKSKLQRHMPGNDKDRVVFDDVAGVEQAKKDLAEVIQFLREPSRFTQIGAKVPRGILLIGPPGTGKTMLARAVAGEAKVPFFSVSGSDFVEMFVGVGASRVRDTFSTARKNAPCIVFIDEIDAMGRSRGAAAIGNDEREQTLNQMLVEMSGFSPSDGVIVIAATNRPDVLDPALLRPGRFDRQVVVPNPDISGREAILRVHCRKIKLRSENQDELIHVLARGTPGFSGADLANLVNEAAIGAAQRGAHEVDAHDFETAKDKLMLGAERRSLVMTPKEKHLTAMHEAGHALCAILEPASDPVHKVTIVPRGIALGMVFRLPETDRLSMTRAHLMADLTVAMGGRAAEKLLGDDNVTTGAQGDIQVATNIARKMVTMWGFSTNLGMVHYPSDDSQNISMFSSNSGAVSDMTRLKIDEEVRNIIAAAYARADEHLKKNRDVLDAITSALVERETLTGADVIEIFNRVKDKEHRKLKRQIDALLGPAVESKVSGGDSGDNIIV